MRPNAGQPTQPPLPFCFASGVAAGATALEALAEAGLSPAFVLAYDSSLSHRSGFASLSSLAGELQLPSLATADINSQAVLDALRPLNLSLLVIAGWSQIASPELLSLFRHGGVGLHPALLPEGRGRAPLPWTLIKGLDRSGTTLFRLTEDVDAGDILAQQAYPVTVRDSAASLYQKAAAAHATLLVQELPRLLGGDLSGHPQRATTPPWPRRRPADGAIEWDSHDGNSLYNFIRAQTRPYPGAFTKLPSGDRLTIWSADLLPVPLLHPSPAGTVVGPVLSTSTAGVAVVTADHRVMVLRTVQIDDEESTDALVLLETRKLISGDRLG